MKNEDSRPSALQPTSIDRNEWIRRYAAQLMQKGAMPETPAIQVASEAADFIEQEERPADVWNWITPEDYADEEMSNWESDGE